MLLPHGGSREWQLADFGRCPRLFRITEEKPSVHEARLLWLARSIIMLSHVIGSAEQVRSLLNRAASLLRLPTSPDLRPEVMPDGSGLRCPRTGQVYPHRDGILHLLPAAPALTVTQRFLT